MKRIDEDTIALTQEELSNIQEFIRNTLYCEWDRHTDTYICSDSTEDGMKRMDPEMYEFAEQIQSI